MESMLYKLHFISWVEYPKKKFNESKSDLELELESRKSEEILEIFTAVDSATFEEF